MPRGNDAVAAAEELRARIGANPNAEDMIALSAARWPQELRAANNRTVDAEATDNLDEDSVAGLVGDRNVLAFAVRGPFLVVVSEDDTGFTIKQAFPREGHEKQAERFMPEDPDEVDKRNQEEQEERVKQAEENRDEEADRRSELSRGQPGRTGSQAKESDSGAKQEKAKDSGGSGRSQQTRSQARE